MEGLLQELVRLAKVPLLYNQTKAKRIAMLNIDYIDNVLLHLSAKCNCNCSHCYVKSFCELPSIENAVDDIVSVLKYIPKPVHITGGEVMCLSNFEKWIDVLLDNNINLTTIYTNGTLIEEHKTFLEKLYIRKPNIRFIISLDGVNETHDTFRQENKYTFDKALSGAIFVRKIGFQVFINTMLYSQTRIDDLVQLHNLIMENNFNRWRIDRPFAMGNWINHTQMQLSWEKCFTLFSYIVKLWKNSHFPYELEIDHTFKYLSSKITIFDKYSLEDPICPCRAFPIWPNGDVTWCQILHNEGRILGNIMKTSVKQLIDSYNLYKSKKIGDFVKNKKCASCALLTYCGAGCRANALMAYGQYDEPDPDFCEIFKNQLQKKVLRPLIGQEITK